MTSNLPFVSLCAIAVTGCSQFEGLRRAAGPWEFIWDPPSVLSLKNVYKIEQLIRGFGRRFWSR
jgi:hypothetical protein